MNYSQQQLVDSLRAWFQSKRDVFNFSGVVGALNRDLSRHYLSVWVSGVDVLNQDDFFALVQWAKLHGFRMGPVEPIQAEFTVDRDNLTGKDGAVMLDAMKRQAGRALGIHLLENGFLTLVEMGDVSKPNDFRRTMGFRLIGRAEKSVPDETK